MNFGNDLTKIPRYPIPGISDLVDELPHAVTNHALNHPHPESRHEIANKILKTQDAAFMNHIVDTVAGAPDYRTKSRDGNVDGLAAGSLYQALPQEMYSRNMVQQGINQSIGHLGFTQHSQHPVSGPLQSFPLQNDQTASARVNPLLHGNTNRPVAKPVQAVAPQPRHPRQFEKSIQQPQSKETKQNYYQEKNTQEPAANIQQTPAMQEENPKICLKIRRTKKNKSKSRDRGERSAGNEPVEYGVVSSDKPENNPVGPIKLTLTRVKTSGSSESSGSKSDQAFKVSSIVGASSPRTETKQKPGSESGQKKAEDAAVAMVKQVFNNQYAASVQQQQALPNSSKLEKEKNRHRPYKIPQSHPQTIQATNHQSRDFKQDRGNSHSFVSAPKPKTNTSAIEHRNPSDFQNPTQKHSMIHPRETPKPALQQVQQQRLPSTQDNHNFTLQSQHPQHRTPSSHFLSPTFTPQQLAQHFPYSNVGTPPNMFSSPNMYNQSSQQGGFVSPQSYPSHLLPGQSQVNSYMQQSLWDNQQVAYTPQLHNQTVQNTPVKPPPYSEAIGGRNQGLETNKLSSHITQPGFISPRANLQQNFQPDLQEVANAQQRQVPAGGRQLHATFSTKDVSSVPIPTESRQSSFQSHHLSPSVKTDSLSQVHMSSAPKRTIKENAPYPLVNYCNAPQTHPSSGGKSRHSSISSSSHGSNLKRKGVQHIRVKFIADAEEADIYKLKDVLYPDDTEVNDFGELQPGTEIVAKWPMNGKRYAAIVIDPLDNTGRRFRERKPPPKPFQAQVGSGRRERRDSYNQPSVVIDKIDVNKFASDTAIPKHLLDDNDFGAYTSMADRIKDKKRKRNETKGQKRKHESSARLITMQSDDSADESFRSPDSKRSHQEEMRKRERRKAVESRIKSEDGAGLFHHMNKMISTIFDNMDSIDPRILAEAMDEGNSQKALVPQCLLLSRPKLQELSGELAKLKATGHLCGLPKKSLVRLLTILEPNIRDGVHLRPLKPTGHSSEEQKWNRESKLERINGSTEAALAAMHVLTAHNMPKAVYLDDIMERSAQLLRQQLSNTIYPEYDLVYRSPNLTSTPGKKKGGKAELASTASTRMKRAHYKGPKNRTILQLYNKLNILLGLWVELVTLQPMTDTTVLQISSIGVSPFFVENVRELQLSAIRLTTAIFSRYDKHRSLILEDIFQSLARLPTSKRNLRSYRLTYAEEDVASSDEEETSAGRKSSGGGVGSELQYIQMVSALVLQMMHAICQLPHVELPDENESANNAEKQLQVDDLKIITSYDMSSRTGQNFLSVFLKKCAGKSEEVDYRPLFENLVHDLLATVNKPEWPASEMLLSLLGRLLVHTFSTKSTEMSLRVAALDYLGVVAAKLRRDSVSSHSDVATIRNLLQRLEEAAEEEPMEGVEQENEKAQEETKKATRRSRKKQKTIKLSKAKKSTKSLETEEERLNTRLQYLILGYLRRNSRADPALLFAHNFYIGQWLRDVSLEFQQLQKADDVTGDDAINQMDAQSDKLQACQRRKDSLMEIATSAAVSVAALKRDQNPEADGSKKLPPISELQLKAEKLAGGLTVEDASLVTRHLASTRPFSKAFDLYLSYILRVREETAVALRTRAIKCLAEVVAVDPSIMEREDIAQGVQASLVDASTSVREAAIDLVGKFILLKPQLVKHYYHMLTARIMDTGVSVRKRVIRILRDLCHEHPQLPQLTDACVKMIRRVNDEEGIKKLVHEVFMKMWFTPLDSQDTESLRKRALLITDIVAANRERGYEWIEQLFKNLIDTTVPNPNVERSCKQIVDCLVQHVIIFDKQAEENEKNALKEETNSEKVPEEQNCEKESEKASETERLTRTRERGIRLVATIQTLVQLARIRPVLLVPHLTTLQPYLAAKCDTPDEALIIHGVCRILELAVPLMEHPSDLFLASIEEDMTRLTLTHRFHVVIAAVACLGAITCKVTFNYRLIWDCFQRMCNQLSNARQMHQQKPELVYKPLYMKQLLRTLFVVGHFCKNFDFDQENLKGKLQLCVKDKVYECLFYFADLRTTPHTEELRGFSVAALGLLMVQDPNMMFRQSTRDLYNSLLDPGQASNRLKKQILQNLQNYLQTEDVKMQEAAEASARKAKQEGEDHEANRSMSADDTTTTEDDIKEICDVSSGMASSVMQLFLKQVLESFFHRHAMVRHAALHTVFLTLQQGLVHPVQCVPYLIAAASDPTPAVHKEADQQLSELSKRYSGFIHTQALQGMKLAHRLQRYVRPTNKLTRGYMETTVPGLDESVGLHKASCSHLYQMVRSDRKHRRALILSLLKLFDDTVKTELSMLLFIADNLAHFPYATLDEPLFLMSQIEVYVSVSGTNVLQCFKESLKPKMTKKEVRLLKRKEKLDAKERKKMEKIEKKRARKRSSDEDASSSSSSSSSESDSSSSSSSEEDEEDEDDENDDVDGDEGIERMITRLPDADEPVKEFAHLSLACLLLLWVKHHLKSMFGFTDNKIHKYSPSEVNRANDRPCHRRRADLKFEPTRALQHLERTRQGMSCKHPDYKRSVVEQYYEFNEWMNKLDPNEDDSDSENNKKTPSKQSSSTVLTVEAPLKEHDQDDEDSDRDSDDDVNKPRPALAAIRQSTALKSKKHSSSKQRSKHSNMVPGAPPEMRKRSTVHYADSSSESDEEFTGF